MGTGSISGRSKAGLRMALVGWRDLAVFMKANSKNIRGMGTEEAFGETVLTALA